MKNILLILITILVVFSCNKAKSISIGNGDNIDFNLALTPYSQVNESYTYSNISYFPLNSFIQTKLYEVLDDRILVDYSVTDFEIEEIEIFPTDSQYSIADLDIIEIAVGNKRANIYRTIYNESYIHSNSEIISINKDEINNKIFLEMFKTYGDLDCLITLIPKSTSNSTEKLIGNIEFSYNFNFLYKNNI